MGKFSKLKLVISLITNTFRLVCCVKSVKDVFKCNHLCLSADREAVVLQNFHQGEFNQHQSESHPQTVPWARAERQVSVRVDAPLVLLTEPEKPHTWVRWTKRASVTTKVLQHRYARWRWPVRFELLRLRPKVGVAVKSVDRNHYNHVLWDCDSTDLHRFFGNSVQTSSWRVEPINKTI